MQIYSLLCRGSCPLLAQASRLCPHPWLLSIETALNMDLVFTNYACAGVPPLLSCTFFLVKKVPLSADRQERKAQMSHGQECPPTPAGRDSFDWQFFFWEKLSLTKNAPRFICWPTHPQNEQISSFVNMLAIGMAVHSIVHLPMLVGIRSTYNFSLGKN
jgi:hypothetical protein